MSGQLLLLLLLLAMLQPLLFMLLLLLQRGQTLDEFQQIDAGRRSGSLCRKKREAFVWGGIFSGVGTGGFGYFCCGVSISRVWLVVSGANYCDGTKILAHKKNSRTMSAFFFQLVVLSTNLIDWRCAGSGAARRGVSRLLGQVQWFVCK